MNIITQSHAVRRRRRTIGWYAIQLAHMLDRLKLYRRWRRAGVLGAQQAVAANMPSAAEVARSSETTKLQEAVRDTHRILAQARSIFPLMLFPDTITVDR